MKIRTSDGEEVLRAGQAYYLQPGHVPSTDEGVEFLEFTPASE